MNVITEFIKKLIEIEIDGENRDDILDMLYLQLKEAERN